jgi:hydroxymethylglutaryl-CoA synthase
VLKLL